MRELERLLDVKGDAQDARKQMISAIAAWAIDHPGQKVEAKNVFPQMIKRLKDAIFADKRGDVAKRARDVVVFVRDEGSGLDDARRREARAVLDRLASKFGYCDSCAADMASMLVRKRYNDLIVA